MSLWRRLFRATDRCGEGAWMRRFLESLDFEDASAGVALSEMEGGMDVGQHGFQKWGGVGGGPVRCLIARFACNSEK